MTQQINIREELSQIPPRQFDLQHFIYLFLFTIFFMINWPIMSPRTI
jgi:hypothetical protein